MSTVTVWLVVAYLAGVFASILLPYFLAWLETGEKFDWRMNVARIVTALFALFPTMAAADFIEQLGAAGYLGAFVLGLGFSQLGRMAQKTAAVAAKSMAGEE